MDDHGEYEWPRQADPFALGLPDLSAERFRCKSSDAVLEQLEDRAIARHFTSTLKAIAELQDQRGHHDTGHHHSYGERIFAEKKPPHKENPAFVLTEIVLVYGSALQKAGISDAKYFELFNILFGLPAVSLKTAGQMPLAQFHHHLQLSAERAKKTHQSFAEASRKRRLQFFLEAHIAELGSDACKLPAQSAEVFSLSTFKKQVDREIQNSISAPLVLQIQRDDDRVNHGSPGASDRGVIKVELGKYNNDFLASYLSLLQTLDREAGLETLFSKARQLCHSPHFPRKGDEVIFELLRIYELVAKNERVTLDLRFSLAPATTAVLRWAIGQYLRSPLPLSPIEASIQADFSIEGLSNVELLNLCALLSSYGLKAEQLFVLCFSSFAERERLPWEQHCQRLAAEAAGELLHNAELKHILVSAGIPKRILDFAMAQLCRAQGKHAEAITYFLDCHMYERALDLFLKTQLQTLTCEPAGHAYIYLPLFITATNKAQASGKCRKIVEILSIYFSFVEFFHSPDEVDPAELKVFLRELLIRLPSPASCTADERACLKFILNSALKKAAECVLEDGSQSLGRNLLDRETVKRMVSNAAFLQELEIDSALLQNILLLSE